MSVNNLWLETTPLSHLGVQQYLPIALPSHTHDSCSTASQHLPQLSATYNALELAAICCNRAKYSDECKLTDAEAAALGRTHMLSSLDSSLTFSPYFAASRGMFPSISASPNKSVRPGHEASLTLRRALAVLGEGQSGVASAAAGEAGPLATPLHLPRHPHLHHHLQPSIGSKGASQLMREAVDVEQDTRPVLGDATDTALFKFVATRQNVELVRYHNPIVFEQAFNSRNKYALTICKPHHITHQSPSATRNIQHNNAYTPSKHQSNSNVNSTQTQPTPYQRRRLFMKGTQQTHEQQHSGM